VLFNDHETAKQIMKAKSPVVQKRLGRKVKPFDPRLWDSKCVSVVKKGNMAKVRKTINFGSLGTIPQKFSKF